MRGPFLKGPPETLLVLPSACPRLPGSTETILWRMYFLNDQNITPTGAEQFTGHRSWQEGMVSPSMCPLSKVRTSYRRALQVWKGTESSLLPQREKASDHFWECERTNESPATAAIKGSCLFAKHSNAIWQFRWRQQAQKNNCPHWLLHHSLPALLSPPPWQKPPALSWGQGQSNLWKKTFFPYFLSQWYFPSVLKIQQVDKALHGEEN